MNLKHIEAFRAVMVSGSMTAAAKALFTSQPNVSRLISQLERDTGLQLFQRSGVRLIPTSEGTAFFREVERAFVGLQGLANAAAQIRNLGSGRLRIAAMPSAGMTLVPHAIKRFHALFPDVTVSLHVNTSGTVNHWTASRFCDLGVAVYVSEASDCEVEQLSNVAAVCVMPANHRLAAKRNIRPKDLEGESFISLCHGDGTRAVMDEVFQRAGVQRVLAIEAQYTAMCCEMVRHGMGVTLAHPIVARDFVGPDIVIRPFQPVTRFPTYLLFPPHRPRERLASAFVEVLRELHDELLDGIV
ncbi:MULTISPECIES: LysR substrate-binding domain-containing protein [Caballeronia]|jgi:DNA-binding transcriptional LysR family regulator|uniref:LysR family transcriptional regulator n=1 Tax=Caballeronia zhejiangensis TaxID=871203 RepID=A0A656QQN3_9BURK|nr:MULTISPECIES: LysR substrate-binding domain-containing protein [Caballeronia]EKS69919.1 LysR family transcriptional regulator [Burkholderia sp. SJ98]KDR32358.1 LysR family transcriptional regulator [Caballeronia zhejiangensis]MDR5791595.1 LysR substrate-binding domain-containing protein [Caballeronia sp. LP003]MDR5796037.1 LysR substrate-binding domain-containing protein [Caballeronia sp. LZ008]